MSIPAHLSPHKNATKSTRFSVKRPYLTWHDVWLGNARRESPPLVQRGLDTWQYPQENQHLFQICLSKALSVRSCGLGKCSRLLLQFRFGHADTSTRRWGMSHLRNTSTAASNCVDRRNRRPLSKAVEVQVVWQWTPPHLNH